MACCKAKSLVKSTGCRPVLGAEQGVLPDLRLGSWSVGAASAAGVAARRPLSGLDKGVVGGQN
jgi:hypothetical protein